MNILIYVMTMLMLLTLLTYSRIESYRSFSVMESQFVNYMEKEERSYTNNRASARYAQTVVNKQKNPNKDTAPGSGRLNLSPLLQLPAANDNGDTSKLTFELTKKLITNLYHTQPFFITLEKERPNFVEEILKDILQSQDSGTVIKEATDLSNIKIANDPTLDMALYEILNGFPATELLPDKETNVKETNVKEKDTTIADSQDEEDEVLNEAYETHAEMGMRSLFDYITVKKNGKTRVYLASRPLLLAIYEDPLTVQQIIEARNTLYQRFKNNPEEKNELSTKFEEQFKRGHALQYEQILDFKISGTNPKNYE